MLSMLEAKVCQCKICPDLVANRLNTVFGTGNINSKVMFIGEAPGEKESQTGKPFVGKAGQLLTGMIQACGWNREDVFITNCLKCRPPDNRKPLSDEIQSCRPYLELQIKVINPKYIVCFGATAAEWFIPDVGWMGVSKFRHRVHQWQNRKVFVTYHPSYVLHADTLQKANSIKQMIWTDLQLLLDEMKQD